MNPLRFLLVGFLLLFWACLALMVSHADPPMDAFKWALVSFEAIAGTLAWWMLWSLGEVTN